MSNTKASTCKKPLQLNIEKEHKFDLYGADSF